MNTLATIPPTEANSLMEVIARAASDPTVDVTKMERLFEMHGRLTAIAAQREYNNAMADAQAEMLPISQDASNPQTRSKYASYNALDRVTRPIYAKHGFALSFDTADGAPESYVRVVCLVSHRGGHVERKHLDMPADGKGAKGNDVMTKTHATMSAVSYGRRGLLKMAFNLAEGEHDDDGNAAGGSGNGAGGKITGTQTDTILALVKETGSNLDAFCKYFRVESVVDIPAKDFDRAVAALKAKAARK